MNKEEFLKKCWKIQRERRLSEQEMSWLPEDHPSEKDGKRT